MKFILPLLFVLFFISLSLEQDTQWRCNCKCGPYYTYTPYPCYPQSHDVRVKTCFNNCGAGTPKCEEKSDGWCAGYYCDAFGCNDKNATFSGRCYSQGNGVCYPATNACYKYVVPTFWVEDGFCNKTLTKVGN